MFFKGNPERRARRRPEIRELNLVARRGTGFKSLATHLAEALAAASHHDQWINRHPRREAQAMPPGRTQFSIRGLMIVVAITAILVGGAMNFLRDPAPTRPFVPPRSIKGRVIMEGVDINSNGPRHATPRAPQERDEQVIR
jgi:hypothetical protein